MNRRLERVHIESLRVALMATGIFAVIYAIVATLIVVLVTNNLTSQIDTTLASCLSTVQTTQSIPVQCASADFRGPGSARLGGPQFAYYWVMQPDGTQATNAGATLPSSDQAVTTPRSDTLYGVELRLSGTTVAGVHVVVAQRLTSVAQTQSTISSIELFVGLVLLVVAFVGSLIGGRRVGAPIELARQRQMEFTADASHELRTPLSVIEAQTSLALTQERDTAWYRAAFERVGGESKRIRGLVEDLLWLARADSEPTGAHAEPVEVGVLATQAVDRFNAVAEARGLTLQLAVGAEPHMVLGSAEWLDRLLGVIIDNACKYAPEHGAVRVTVANDGGRVRAVVEDSGPGIPEGERARIFERFHRATSAKSGAGLGLAIADAVVRRTHGRWEVSASPDLGGASVAVSWPRPAPARGTPPEPRPLRLRWSPCRPRSDRCV